MKKIFATILALVMVLAMGSSLAMSCLTIDWSSVTNCGVGTVEVIPYVLNNANGGMVSYTANDCAGAVNSQFIYYAVRVTVQEQPNQDWWDNAKLEVTLGDGLANQFMKAPSSVYAGGTVTTSLTPDNISGAVNGQINASGTTFLMGASAGTTGIGVDNGLWLAKNGGTTVANNKDVSAGTYYLSASVPAGGGTGTFGFTTGFTPANNLFAAQVVNTSANVQVCAKLSSSATVADGVAIDINGWTVYTEGNGSSTGLAMTGVPAEANATWAIVLNDGATYVRILFNDGGTFKGVQVTNDTFGESRLYHSFEGGVYIGTKYNGTTADSGVVADAACRMNDDYKLIQSAFAAINYQWGFNTTVSNAEAKLKWDGKSEDCHTWGSAATAIVDTNCVIEIPKTGDVSVVAYAVMALVTAAGALKFRK